jgi:hypothetical protein
MLLELATNATSTTTPIDPNLVGTWALVAVALTTVMLTALQNRRTQQLMAQQTRVMGEQMKQAILQTQLQQEQFGMMVLDEQRPRVEELIQAILSPTIRILDNNTARGRAIPLEIREYLTLFLTDKHNTLGGLVFRDFEVDHKDLAAKMKRYDAEVCEPIRIRWSELNDALITEVTRALPSIIEKYNASVQGLKVDITNVRPHVIVSNGIFPALQGQPEQVVIPQDEQIWKGAKNDFLKLTDKSEIVARINNLKSATGKCANVSEALSEELSELRNRLGTKYNISRDHYFAVSILGRRPSPTSEL